MHDQGTDAVNNDDIAFQSTSRGDTNIQTGFVDYVSYLERRICLPIDERAELDRAGYNMAGAKRKRTPIKVKCLTNHNATTNATLMIVDSLKDVTALLGPYENGTRAMSGICAVILFYTKSCASSALAAPHMNALPKYYTDIRMGAIDSFRFHSVNSDFGIIALPTLMLFHRGRPVAKFNESHFTVYNFIKFIGRHTDIYPNTLKVFVTSDDFRGPLPNNVEKDTDHCLWLSWLFIVVVLIYHFSKSTYYAQIVEVMRHYWRESIETQLQ